MNAMLHIVVLHIYTQYMYVCMYVYRYVCTLVCMCFEIVPKYLHMKALKTTLVSPSVVTVSHLTEEHILRAFEKKGGFEDNI